MEKTLEQVLAEHLQKVIPTVISKNQTGYIRDRNTNINIRSILDIIQHTNDTKQSSLLAFLDFEKAFYKLNRKYVKTHLKKWIRSQIQKLD